jgi:FkbM family methyltransferase
MTVFTRNLGGILHRGGFAPSLMPIAHRDRNPLRSRLRNALSEYYASHDVVHGWVPVPASGGLRCYANLNDESVKPLVHYGEALESAEVSYLEGLLRPEDVVFDIGANYGLFSWRIAESVRSGEIHLFEPNPALFRCLQKTARRHSGFSLHLHRFAVGEQDGTAIFHVPVSQASMHGSLERHEWGMERGIFPDALAQEVELRSIDSVVTELRVQRLDLLKIDVEGTESDVVAGMRSTLTSLRPRIVMCETSLRSNAFDELRARYAQITVATDSGLVSIDSLPRDFWGNLIFTDPV